MLAPATRGPRLRSNQLSSFRWWRAWKSIASSAPTTSLANATDCSVPSLPGAILLNTGRGGIVDEHALAELLRTGRLAGAGLDVFASEPVQAASPLLTLDNVVVTPHVAWLTGDTLIRCVRVGVDNARHVRAGDPIANRVV